MSVSDWAAPPLPPHRVAGGPPRTSPGGRKLIVFTSVSITEAVMYRCLRVCLGGVRSPPPLSSPPPLRCRAFRVCRRPLLSPTPSPLPCSVLLLPHSQPTGPSALCCSTLLPPLTSSAQLSAPPRSESPPRDRHIICWVMMFAPSEWQKNPPSATPYGSTPSVTHNIMHINNLAPIYHLMVRSTGHGYTSRTIRKFRS